jgi:hypothetical protein
MENYLLFREITDIGEKLEISEIRFDRRRKELGEMLESVEIPGYAGKISLKGTAAFPYPDRVADGCGNREAYGIVVKKDGVIFFCDSARALFYALTTLSKFAVRNGGVYQGVYSDYPSFKIRGMIEGFYGRPWTMARREKALEIMAENRMNTYIYGPKDDPYHRDFWRRRYDDESIGIVREMLSLCEKNHLDMHYMLAPGLDIEYSSDDELSAAVAKYRQVYDLGVTKFGLLLDDISPDFTHESDRKSFDTLADAHISLTNRIYGELKKIDKSIELVVCPTQYYGRGDEEYISRLGKGIPEDCRLFFTGEKICSAKITTKQAEFLYRNTNHKALYWDNYPVNDCEMVNEFHISPIINRDTDLHRYSEGITLNPMEAANCSLFSIITYAHFMWDSEAYDPERSYGESVSSLIGTGFAEPMRVFSGFLYKSCLLRHGWHYRYEKPERYHETVAGLIERRDFTGLREYMAYAREQLLELRDLPEEYRREFQRWHDTALACCDIFIGLLDGIGSGKGFEELTTPLVRYFCRAEDVMKHEAERLLYAVYDEMKQVY